MDLKLEAFETAALKVKKWHKLSAPNWGNRIKKWIKYPLRYPAYQFSKKSPVSLTTKTFWADKFQCYLPDYFLTWCYGILGDPAEVRLTRFLIKNLKKGDVVLDVGSNCGFYTMLASQLVGEAGSAHAFEPTPNIYTLLKGNISSYKNAFAIEAAVCDKDGRADFSINSVNTVANSLSATAATKSNEAIIVKTASLDTYCASKSISPTFIKLDIEGAEELAVLGAVKILENNSPLVCMEVLRQNDQLNISATKRLIDMGYVPHRISESGELENTSLEKIQGALSKEEDSFDNFIFKKI